MSSPATPPGWYPDPDGSGRKRYWDGDTWHASTPATPPVRTPQWLKYTIPVAVGLFVVLVFVVLFVPRGEGNHDEFSEAQVQDGVISTCQDSIRDTLRDPDSAKFDGWTARHSSSTPPTHRTRSSRSPATSTTWPPARPGAASNPGMDDDELTRILRSPGIVLGVAVTRITVTELPPNELTSEPWRVDWTDKRGDHTSVHDSKRAAQRLVSNLLKDLGAGLSKDDVLTINRLDQENPSA